MSSLIEMLTQQISGGALSQMSRKLGTNEGATQAAVSAAVPLLIAALAKNAAQPEGAQALHQALARDHDGGLLDDVAGFLGGGGAGAGATPGAGAADGAGILRHVLGDRRGALESKLGGAAGLDANATARLLEMVAPLVMGALGRAQRQGGLDAGALASMLGGQSAAARAQSPDVMGMLGSLLDSDKDGSVVDDLGRIAGKLFGGKS
ncbi:MAG: DUF937 domain-containing protein [bacterium]